MACLFSVAPKWLIEPTNVMKVIGEDAEMKCVAEGTPTPTVKWSKHAKSKYKICATVNTNTMNLLCHTVNYNVLLK